MTRVTAPYIAQRDRTELEIYIKRRQWVITQLWQQAGSNMTKLMCLPVSHNIFDVSSSVFSVPRAKTKLPISLQFCGIPVSLDFHSSLFNFSKDCCILVCSYIGPISFCMDQKSQDVSLFNVQMQWALIVGYYPSLHRHLCTFSSAVQFDVSFEGWGGGHFLNLFDNQTDNY